MILYGAWILYSAKREKRRIACLLEVNIILKKNYSKQKFKNKKKKSVYKFIYPPKENLKDIKILCLLDELKSFI